MKKIGGKFYEDFVFFLQGTIVWLAVAQEGRFGVLWADKFSKVGEILEGTVICQKDRFDMVRATEILSSGHTARVAKCHRYGRYICVIFLDVWGKILECNIRVSDVG